MQQSYSAPALHLKAHPCQRPVDAVTRDAFAATLTLPSVSVTAYRYPHTWVRMPRTHWRYIPTVHDPMHLRHCPSSIPAKPCTHQ